MHTILITLAVLALVYGIANEGWIFTLKVIFGPEL